MPELVIHPDPGARTETDERRSGAHLQVGARRMQNDTRVCSADRTKSAVLFGIKCPV